MSGPWADPKCYGRGRRRSPLELDHVSAAALPTAALTASQALADVPPGQRVLIHTTGGVGYVDELDHAAVDFAEVVADVDVGVRPGRRLVRLEVAGGARAGVLIDAQGNDAEGDPRYRRFYLRPFAADLVEAMAACGCTSRRSCRWRRRRSRRAS